MRKIQLWYIVGATLIAVSTAQADYTVLALPGYTAIANQLDKGGNTLDEVLPAPPPGAVIYKWDCTTWKRYSYFDDLNLGWVPNGTLVPGEGALISNPSGTAMPLTFTGTPHVPVLPAALPCGCGNLNCLSCQTATAGTYENITGKSPTEGAVVQRWNPTTQAWETCTFSGGAWSPAVPIANVGEAVWIKVPCATNVYKWNQPPVTGGQPTNIFYGWNQISTEYAGKSNWQAADDWVCTTTNPVTKVRWWGSFANWQATNLPPSLSGNGALNGFWIVFFADVPAGMDLPFSHPAYFIMPPLARFYTNYTWRYVGRDYDPRTGTYESCFLFEQVLQKDANVDWWFYQNNSASGTNIYWLSIIANQWGGGGGPGDIPPADHFFGWKTRPRSTNSPAPDDAVTYNIDAYGGSVPFNFQPIWWPEPTSSWDLAFELITASGGGTAKYEQLPDLSTYGMDVNATSNSPSFKYLLADDFPCTAAGPITNITIWGSWKNDYLPFNNPANVVFTLSLHTNVPPGTIPWSMPGQMKSKRTYLPGQFTCTVEQSPLDEWWMDPQETAIFPGDHTCYRYDFVLPLGAFVQQGSAAAPAIYWLDVQAQPQDPVATFGWKTSPTHWMDAACYALASEPYNGTGWTPLTYPPTHQLYGQHIDLSFRLNGVSQTVEIPKWSQLPVPYTPTNGYNGWNQYSVYGGTNIVADDWVCTNAMPVTDIHWWGSFIGWGATNLPPVVPNGFVISIWSDVPKGAGVPFSHPGMCLSNIYCTSFAPAFVGWDYDPRNPGSPPDACFKFQQDLTQDQWFRQAPGTNTYWISIAAQYPAGQAPDYPWGWKTRPRDTNSLAPDDAVRIFGPTAPLPGMPYGNGTNLWWPTTNSSWDMAFALTTLDESNCVKVVCSTNITVTCAPTNGAVVTYYSYATNICTGQSLPVSCTPSSGSLFPVGTNQVWCTNVTAGVTNYCSFFVTVLTDTTGPVITCSTNIVANTDPGKCSKSNVTFVVTAKDDCDPAPVIICNPTNGSTFPKGVTTVNCTATDAAGNSSSCSFTVTILDKELPSVYCPTNIVANTDPGKCSKSNVTFVATATDNCPGVTVSCSPPSGSTFPKGITMVTCTAVDASGNTNTCNFTVTILDKEAPSVTCSSNIVANTDPGKCSKSNVTFTATATDNCPGVTVACVPPSGSTFAKGVTTVTCTATDASGNTNSCSFTVTILDKEPPSVTCSSNIVANTDPGLCSKSNVVFTATASDNCAVTNLVCSPPSGSTFAKGVTTVTCTATDSSGNTNLCSFTVTILDKELPSVSCSSNIVANTDPGLCSKSNVTFVATASDNCAVTNLVCNPPSGSTFAKGVTTVTCTATDASGNTNSCNFTVTILDKEAPSVTCSSNIVANTDPGKCSKSNVTFTATATDNCPGVTVACVPPSGSTFAKGVTTVTCTATDASGNTNSCSFTVTILDKEPPSVSCSSNIVANTDPGLCSKSNVVFTATASDNCAVTNLVCSPPSGSTFPKGVTTVICTATDSSGNTNSCSFTVTILDKELPSVSCSSNIVANTDPGLCSKSNVTFVATASDNCPGVTVACVPPSGSTFPKGVTTVKCTATDASGNTNSCSFTVTILDREPPSITCSSNIVVDSLSCNPIVVNYPPATASDNCAVTNVSCVPPSGSTFPVGTNTVQCTATDSSGNTSTCTFTVTVTCLAKWVQEPDLSPNGFDVRALRPKILADDFLCMKSGPITNIHIWASWLGDLPDLNATFQLGLWSDTPRGSGPSVQLITNGTFELAFTNAGLSGLLDGLVDFIPPSWYRVETFSGQVVENSAIGPVPANGPSAPGVQATKFSRSAGGKTGDWTAIAQNLSINVNQYTSLKLSMDVRVWSHDLVAGGTVTPAFEWPAMVEVDYVDTSGLTQIWRYGWYLDPPGDGVRINDPGQGLIPFYNDQLVPQGVWVANSFNLLNELPQVQTITRIAVGGTGWNFESDVDNVSLQGTTIGFSHPGELLWLSYFTNGQYRASFYPGIQQPFFDPNLGEVIGSDTQVWEYDFPIRTNLAFWQTNCHIYWLSVSAQAQSQNYFGWKTAVTNWNDDAVFGHVDNAWLPLRDWQELFAPNSTRSLNLAFALTTMGVVAPPVITNVWVTNQVTLTATNQVVGLAWTAECGARYQVLSAPDLGSNGSSIVWSPCGPEIIGPNNWYWETNTVLTQRFYRVLARP